LRRAVVDFENGILEYDLITEIHDGIEKDDEDIGQGTLYFQQL
jgi:hypothetical protein